MEERKLCCIRVYQCKRRARDLLRINSQCGSKSLHEDCFAGTERTTEQDYFAAGKLLAKLLAEVEGFGWAARDQFAD